MAESKGLGDATINGREMVITMGTGILFMALIPNPAWGRLLFVLCSLVVLLIGASLRIGAGRSEVNPDTLIPGEKV